MSLKIDPEALRLMVADAEEAFPDECCGFAFGREADNCRHILEALPVHNAKEGDKRRRFEIAPRDYLRAERHAAERGLELLGVYHSHPNHPPLPSEHDRAAAQPFFSYLIFSVHDGRYQELRSWRLNDAAQFDSETIQGPDET
ncbi:MAG: Mov34/MPN/PAD-1 family protein [Saprospiraceae bacterium]